MLLDDGRASYETLAEAVDLSAPAAGDRIDRLRELGIIEQFSANIDRSRLRDAVQLAVTLDVTPGETTAAEDRSRTFPVSSTSL
jgi:DNA-binding Lrp family transcriptional regulator